MLTNLTRVCSGRVPRLANSYFGRVFEFPFFSILQYYGLTDNESDRCVLLLCLHTVLQGSPPGNA